MNDSDPSSWLQHLNDRIDAGNRALVERIDRYAQEVREQMKDKSDRDSCQRTEYRVAVVEDKHSRLYAKVALLVGLLVGSGLLMKEAIAKMF